MKSTSHFAIAHLLYTALEERDIFLNKTAFLYGNIAPDYVPRLVVTPHFGKVCTRNVEDISRSLSQRHIGEGGAVGAEYSKLLGMMCHYLCDYFCFAHNKEFTGTLRQHPAYENELDSHLRQSWQELLTLDTNCALTGCRSCGMIMREIESEKSAYIMNGFTFDNDLHYSFRACLSAITAIVRISQETAAPFSESLEDFLFSLKGFATGNSYVFRMFLFKNRKNNIFFLPGLVSPVIS